MTLPQSSYFYSVNKDGYNFYTGNINLTGNTPVTVTLSPKTYTVTIFVMDANTGNPISGATVSGIDSGGTTDPNGKLTLTNVTAQSYTVQVSAAGYTATTNPITVNNNQQVNIKLSRASCTITFNITNGAGALVQLSDGSVLNLNSSGGGSVSKPCGEYSYTISKEGYNALSGSIQALSNVTVRGVMASTGGSGGSLAVVGGDVLGIVEIAVVFSPLADSFKVLYKDNPNRWIVAYPVSSGTYQISLLNVAKTFYDYAVAFRPIAMQVVAIGAGGDTNSSMKGGGSGYLSWANVTTLPDINATLTVNVNVGGTVSKSNGQPTTVSIPPYVSTITANGGGNGSNPHGQNRGYSTYFGTGCSAVAIGWGVSSAYVYPEALAIWQELAQTPVIENGVGGGGGRDRGPNEYLHPAQPGGVFLLIRGVVYY